VEDAAQPAADTQDAAEDLQDAVAGLETPEVVASTAGQPTPAVGQGVVTPTPASSGGDPRATPGPPASAAVEAQSGPVAQALTASTTPRPAGLPVKESQDVQPALALRDPSPTPAVEVWGGPDGDRLSTVVASGVWHRHALGTLDLTALTPAPPSALLADILPVDAAALEAYMQRFLDRLDDLGKSVAQPLGRGHLYYWLAGAAAVGAALEFARRRGGLSSGRVRRAGLSDVLDPDLLVPADLAPPEQP
jgi:hypothetical protein